MNEGRVQGDGGMIQVRESENFVDEIQRKDKWGDGNLTDPTRSVGPDGSRVENGDKV